MKLTDWRTLLAFTISIIGMITGCVLVPEHADKFLTTIPSMLAAIIGYRAGKNMAQNGKNIPG